MKQIPQQITDLALTIGFDIKSYSMIAGHGSSRQYYRLVSDGGATCIATTGEDVSENDTFINLTAQLALIGVDVPQVMARSKDGKTYIQEDLGCTSLYDALADARRTGDYTAADVGAVHRAIDTLVVAHGRGSQIAAEPKNFYPASVMGFREMMWDLNYWKYCFVKPAGVSFDESRLEDAMTEFAADCRCVYNGLMMRDYQSRNIMMHDSKAYVIDYQGARSGPLAYDVVSLLWQVRAGLPQAVRDEAVVYYIKRMKGYDSGFDADAFMSDMRKMIILRMLQVIGAYGFRGLIQGKSSFAECIPGALASLSSALDDPQTQIPCYLREVIEATCALPRFAPAEPLTLTVRSFSFKQGRQACDDGGHGGGYTFDCRALHNPGRYEEYKSLTGLDVRVAEFLERNSEAETFLQHAGALVDNSVEVYMRRGFTSLTVDFGCTGGQHRSVYCAHNMARHISDRYGIKVIEQHLVQDITIIHQAKTSQCKQ